MQGQPTAQGGRSVDGDTVDGDIVTDDDPQPIQVSHHTEVEHLTTTLDPQQLQEQQEQQTATHILQQQQQKQQQELTAGELGTQDLNPATFSQQTAIQEVIQSTLNQQVRALIDG